MPRRADVLRLLLDCGASKEQDVLFSLSASLKRYARIDSLFVLKAILGHLESSKVEYAV
jgi:hypothetical protein